MFKIFHNPFVDFIFIPDFNLVDVSLFNGRNFIIDKCLMDTCSMDKAIFWACFFY